jgi:hypothetical protein
MHLEIAERHRLEVRWKQRIEWELHLPGQG